MTPSASASRLIVRRSTPCRAPIRRAIANTRPWVRRGGRPSLGTRGKVGSGDNVMNRNRVVVSGHRTETTRRLPSMDNHTAHLALYDGLTDSEVGHLMVELHTGRFTGKPFEVVTVAESERPVTTMGGLLVMPDALLAELEPADSDLLVLPG